MQKAHVTVSASRGLGKTNAGLIFLVDPFRTRYTRAMEVYGNSTGTSKGDGGFVIGTFGGDGKSQSGAYGKPVEPGGRGSGEGHSTTRGGEAGKTAPSGPGPDRLGGPSIQSPSGTRVDFRSRVLDTNRSPFAGLRVSQRPGGGLRVQPFGGEMGANEGITEKGAAFAKDEINSTVRDEIVEKMLARHLSEKVAGSAAGMIGILIDIATPEETAGPEADERPTFGYADFKPSGNIIEGQAYAPTGAPIGRPVKFPRGQIFH